MLININELVKKYNLKISGILHIGAHECEELNDYYKIGCDDSNIFWIEAMQDKVDYCKQIYDRVNIYQGVVYDVDDKEIEFNITNNGQSSSILEFGSHEINHPDVYIVSKKKMVTSRVDTIVERENIPIEKINFVNLDIQGVELHALKSMEKYLTYVNYIYTEVNTEHVYKNCNLIGEIDEYLSKFGFTRMDQVIYKEYGWGDAFYMKNV
jgi:FkbM family methyltransferase